MSEDLAAGNELLENDESFKEMMALFNEKTYFQRLKGMFEGLKKPKDTKEYKMALDIAAPAPDAPVSARYCQGLTGRDTRASPIIQRKGAAAAAFQTARHPRLRRKHHAQR